MSIAAAIAEQLHALPPERQQEVLDFIKSLHKRATSNPSRPQASAPPSGPLHPSIFGPSPETTLAWLTASGFVINARGTLLMLDPVISRHAERPGAGETGHRLLVELPVEAAQVPRLDAVCYTHADSDHFGRRTAQTLVGTGAAFAGPPPVARAFDALGVPPERQRLARVGGAFRIGTVEITPIRADHPWQLKDPARREPPYGPDDCCGYLLRTPDGTIFYPGDTRLVWEHYQLRDVGVDLLLLDVSDNPYHLGVENGARLANALGVENGARLANALGVPHVIACHFGTFDAPDASAQNGDPAAVAALIDDADRRFHVLAPGALFRVRRG